MKNTRINNEMQTLEELWQSVSELATHVVQDNEKCNNDEYPKDIRTRQVKALEVLLDNIKETHDIIKEH